MSTFRYILPVISVAICTSALADVYMGTGANPSWSPLYPTSISNGTVEQPFAASMPTPKVTAPVATASQPADYVNPTVTSASSYSTTNYTGMPATNMPNPSAAPVVQPPNVPCQQVDMIYGKGPLAPTPCPSPSAVLGQRPVVYQIHTGSLKNNVESIVAKSQWGQVIWSVPNDYRWVGNITITATSVQGALNQLLSQYPVQAVFYDTNRVVNIVPRRQQ